MNSRSHGKVNTPTYVPDVAGKSLRGDSSIKKAICPRFYWLKCYDERVGIWNTSSENGRPCTFVPT